jgi:tetratricopeptide (TPR) repeat protein
VHPSDLWDFDDPVGSEQRFRDAAAAADGEQRGIWLTQLARALGLQGKYAEGHLVLDRLEHSDSPEVACRRVLERGRLHRSAGEPAVARKLFAQAVNLATSAALDELHVDALHMAALVSDQSEQITITQRALAVAGASSDPRTRDWDASLLNNLGMIYAETSDFKRALVCFEAALGARRRIGDPGRTRVSRWMVAWALRNLDRREEALALQQALKAELVALGEEDPYVDEEIAILTGGGNKDP